MIGRHEAAAQASGARIVFSCGFDSIPFDLGVLHLQTQAHRIFGAPLRQVQGRVKVMKGGLSGGTAASLLATLNAASGSAAVASSMRNPFALTPGFAGPAQPDDTQAVFDEAANSWAGPFVMAAINTKNVHRTNALRGRAYGRDFTYDERQLTGPGRGRASSPRSGDHHLMAKPIAELWPHAQVDRPLCTAPTWPRPEPARARKWLL